MYSETKERIPEPKDDGLLRAVQDEIRTNDNALRQGQRTPALQEIQAAIEEASNAPRPPLRLP